MLPATLLSGILGGVLSQFCGFMTGNARSDDLLSDRFQKYANHVITIVTAAAIRCMLLSPARKAFLVEGVLQDTTSSCSLINFKFS